MSDGVVPASAAAEAAAIASAWIVRSPSLIAVLEWHKSLCGQCWPSGRCAEYREIIDEYGAGARGAAVFFPAPDDG